MNIFAVVVLYKILPADSPSLQTLLASAAALNDEARLTVMVWDNTPGGQACGELSTAGRIPLRYNSAPDNPGLSVAYNHALERASAEGYDWLLTLDQDSVLPGDFLSTMFGIGGSCRLSQNIGAVVPRVVASGRDISPFHFLLNAIPNWYSSKFDHAPDLATYAINSGALLRVSALKCIGGYNPLFPLDISDMDMFHRLNRAGFRVHVAGSLRITHDFSILDKSKQMSLERYESQLLDECGFWDTQMGSLARLERIARLIGRAVKDGIGRKSPAHLRTTLRELKRRLLTRRLDRIRNWERMAHQRARRHSDNSPSKAGEALERAACTLPRTD